MPIYKILKIDRKETSTGKLKADLNLQSPDGVVSTGVTIWADFPNFAALTEGITTEGDIVEKQNGQYTNKTLYPARTNTLGAKRPGAGNIVKAMETKAKNIEAAQESKQEGIKISSTFRDATLISIAMLGRGESSISASDMQETWLYWREWLWKNFDNNQPPF